MAGALFALALAYAYDARAGEVVSNDVFSSGTSLESVHRGTFDPILSDNDDPLGPYFWSAGRTNGLGQVIAYGAEDAYDYAAHGLKRNSYLAEAEPSNTNYLYVATVDGGLRRTIFSRQETTGEITNVLVRAGSRESIYCDLLTQFSPSDDDPYYDETARIVVWARVTESDDETATTNLMVTAGCLTNRLKSVVARHYRLDCAIDFKTWYRLTIRAHGDVSTKGAGLSGFTIYLDGQPVRALAEDYEICAAADDELSVLEPEARALVADRRLFHGLVPPGDNKAFTLSGFLFEGEGYVDDISFSSKDPGYGRQEAVFTFNWDAGFAVPLAYTLDGGLTTNQVPVETARRRDILLGSSATNGLTLKVTDFSYKTALGFHPGVWTGSNGATLTNGTSFVYDGTTLNPIATVVSTRNSIDIGPGGYDSFKKAIAALDKSTNAVKTLTLQTNIVVSKSADAGYVNFLNPEGDYVLDLQGHTLKGSGKNPTILVSCKSLKIIDSGDPAASGAKTGRIVPAGSHTNASDRLNTAVEIYPRSQLGGKLVEPLVTLQGGIYDGWVRNVVNTDAVAAVVGAVFVEGGSYISTNTSVFYLENSVTNLMIQFVYRDGYWAASAETNLVIWTGLGDGRRWVDPDNWRIHRVPAETETALFPGRSAEDGPWTVDVEDNRMTTKVLSLEGDVYLSGTNDFLGVRNSGGGTGRLCGDATLVFEGDQPGKLTETLLATNWAGTVHLKNIGWNVPKVLRNLETWGTTDSSVLFNGVQGYVMDVKSHTMPYGVVFQDLVLGSVTNEAWRNDSGYTGSTLEFTGGLSGNGTFRSGKNPKSILQLFKFADAKDFRGKFQVFGKRVLVGRQTVMSSKAGLIAFGDGAVVRSDLGWTCQNAVFGEKLYVLGDTNDVLVTCSQKTAPDVASCTTLYLNYVPDIAWLAATNTATAAAPSWNVYVTGEMPAWKLAMLDPDEPVVAQAAPLFALAASPAASDSAYSKAVSGVLESSVAAYAQQAVENADVSLKIEGDDVIVTVSNASRGLWYGLRHRASLADDWESPATWYQATGSSVTLTYPMTADAGFYGVVVSYADPTGGGGNE